MATTTVGDIIRSAMRKIGVLAAGEPLPADEGDDALQVFEMMVDSWALESLLIPTVNVVTHLLQANASQYTIGIYEGTPPNPLLHIETALPEKILAAFIRDDSGTDYPQEIMDVETFTRISRKTNSSRPSRFYVQQGWPVSTILFESVPFANETLHLSVLQPLSGLLPAASLTEVVNLPPGYRKHLIYNLCLDLADEWGKMPSEVIAKQAYYGKQWLKRKNMRKIVLGADRAVATQRKGIGTYIIEQGP